MSTRPLVRRTVRISVMFDSPGAGFMDIQSQQRHNSATITTELCIGNLKHPFSLTGVNIADPARCQSHLCLVEITVLRGLLIKPSRTFKEMLSHTTAPVHIRPPFFFSAHQRRRIELYSSPTTQSYKTRQLRRSIQSEADSSLPTRRLPVAFRRVNHTFLYLYPRDK